MPLPSEPLLTPTVVWLSRGSGGKGMRQPAFALGRDYQVAFLAVSVQPVHMHGSAIHCDWALC
jgi:hypothetical protein